MKLTRLLDAKFFKFLLVGVGNTVLSATVMFLLYNLAGWGYWISSAISYIGGSVVSFLLNKRFTFGNADALGTAATKFAINIGICYLVAYSIAKPIVASIFSHTAWTISQVEQVAMLVGMVIFTMLNYIGQRFFVFRDK